MRLIGVQEHGLTRLEGDVVEQVGTEAANVVVVLGDEAQDELVQLRGLALLLKTSANGSDLSGDRFIRGIDEAMEEVAQSCRVLLGDQSVRDCSNNGSESLR